MQSIHNEHWTSVWMCVCVPCGSIACFFYRRLASWLSPAETKICTKTNSTLYQLNYPRSSSCHCLTRKCAYPLQTIHNELSWVTINVNLNLIIVFTPKRAWKPKPSQLFLFDMVANVYVCFVIGWNTFQVRYILIPIWWNAFMSIYDWIFQMNFHLLLLAGNSIELQVNTVY